MSSRDRIGQLQQRIDTMLTRRPLVPSPPRAFYRPNRPAAGLVNAWLEEAAGRGVEGIEAVLGKFEQARTEFGEAEARGTLVEFLTNAPEAAELGVHVPRLIERSNLDMRSHEVSPPGQENSTEGKDKR